MTRYECDDCGLAAMDLPDGVDPDFVFEADADGIRCQGCQAATKRCIVHDQTYTTVCSGCRADEIAAEESA